MPDQTILITGCTQGLGRALALKFAAEQCRVYAIGRSQALLDSLVEESSQRIYSIQADIATIEGRENIFKAMKGESAFSLIHNAAISLPTPFSIMKENSVRAHFETNFFAPLLLTQQFLPQLQGQRVLNISTGAALMALENKIPYCTSKGAMHHAIECLQKELNTRGVYFANLQPGMVDTPLQMRLRHTSLEILPTRDFYVRAKEEGKLIAPEIAATFIAWVMLKTEASTFVETSWNIHDKNYQSEWLPVQ